MFQFSWGISHQRFVGLSVPNQVQADGNQPNSHGRSPLHSAANRGELLKGHETHISVIQSSPRWKHMGVIHSSPSLWGGRGVELNLWKYVFYHIFYLKNCICTPKHTLKILRTTQPARNIYAPTPANGTFEIRTKSFGPWTERSEWRDMGSPVINCRK